MLLCGIAGCGAFEETLVCTTEARPSVVVSVQDSVSGLAIAAGATLVLQDGAFVDSLTLPGAWANDALLSTPNSAERPGTYTVTVRRADYADWIKTGVVVRQGRCHVHTVTLTARLKPAI